MKVEIEVLLNGLQSNLGEIIYNSIRPDVITDNNVNINKNPLDIKISADSISRGRAIMNSYLFWIYTILATLKEVDNA